MNKFKTIFLLAVIFSVTFGFSSCLVGLRHDNGYHRGHYKNHRNYNTRVYVPYEGNHRTYKSKPLKEVRKYDDKKHSDSKKNKWNSKK